MPACSWCEDRNNQGQENRASRNGALELNGLNVLRSNGLRASCGEHRTRPPALQSVTKAVLRCQFGTTGATAGGSRTSYVSGRVQEAWETEEEAGKTETRTAA